MEKFSVLLSIYVKEKSENLRQCLDSVLENSVVPDEIVIVKDGTLTEALEETLNGYIAKNEDLYNIVSLENNVGLGLALAEGLKHCSYELVARMDTDDIAVKNRFELQLKAFENDPNLDICGGQIIEFEDDPTKPIAERRVPILHKDIVEYQKKRSAFNHVTVMFKKSKVLEAGNYKDCLLMEDDRLWVDMILSGAVCMNLDCYLCIVRTNREMIARRGGLKYYKKYRDARKQIYDTGFISYKDYIETCIVQFIVCIMPKKLRKFIFFKMLHKRFKISGEKMTLINTTELKLIALNILCQIRDLCDAQNIRYYLDGGTLLGAIRHQGFIPWDDDIDICMPRPDYNRFIEYCKVNETPFGVACYQIDKNFTDLYTKAFDKTTFCKENYGNRFQSEYGVYVDIFPVDGLGNDYESAIKILRKSRFNRSLLTACNWQKYFRSKTKKWYVEPVRFIFYLLSRCVNPHKLIRKIEKTYEGIDFEKSEQVGVVCGCYGDKEVMNRSIYDKRVVLTFENEEFSAMEKYDEFLTNLYGNYMELPPKEKQISHHTFQAYRK